MSDLPEGEPEPDGAGKGPSRNRILVWIIVGGIGLYMLGTGIVGVLTR